MFILLLLLINKSLSVVDTATFLKIKINNTYV